MESFARELPIDNIRVVTNSLPVFLILNERKLTDLILIGGNYRSITGAFVGTLTLQNSGQSQFSKALLAVMVLRTMRLRPLVKKKVNLNASPSIIPIKILTS